MQVLFIQNKHVGIPTEYGPPLVQRPNTSGTGDAKTVHCTYFGQSDHPVGHQVIYYLPCSATRALNLSDTLMASFMPTTSHLPQTLQEWRHQKNQPEGALPRHMWTSLEPFFLSQGYTLWNLKQSSYALSLIPPNDAPRTPDGFAYRVPYNEIKPNPTSFATMVSPFHSPPSTYKL